MPGIIGWLIGRGGAGCCVPDDRIKADGPSQTMNWSKFR
jgi:hypothetical protein